MYQKGVCIYDFYPNVFSFTAVFDALCSVHFKLKLLELKNKYIQKDLTTSKGSEIDKAELAKFMGYGDW